ncbi:MAG TPA: hypothetical protein VGK20_01160 [Candidatus Binatia bacterium]|jgi:hypothetical protein
MRIPQQRFVLVTVIGVLAGAPATALAISSADIACRAEVARSAASYETAVSRLILACHMQQGTGQRSLDEDCNNVAVADSGDTLSSLRANVINGIDRACGQSSRDLLSEYSSCPPPAATADDGGASQGIDSFDEVAQCIIALAETHSGKLGQDAQGHPSELLLKPLLKCQGRLGKGTSAIVRAHLQEADSCQAEKDASDSSPAYDCAGSDPRGRIAKADQKFLAKVGEACNFSPEVLSKLHACGEDEASLLTCARFSADRHGSALARDSYVMDGSANTTTTLQETTTTLEGATTTTLPANTCGSTFPQCDGSCPNGTVCTSNGSDCSCHAAGSGACAPATIHRRIHSKAFVPGSKSSLSTGWSGQADDVDVPDLNNDTVNVTCDDQCQSCAVTLNTNAGDPASTCRCASDSTKTCSVIEGSDVAHCGTTDPTCRCYFGAPLPLSSGGTPACVISRNAQDYSGTMDLRTGEWHDHAHLISAVFLGISKTAPCPTCNNDPTPNDGIRGGTCSQGGNACDVNGVHATFGDTSWDCMPQAAANISGSGLLVDLKSSTEPQSVTAEVPCDTPSGTNCPCRVCTGNGNQGCFTNADCAATGSGNCTDGGGAGVNLNECDGFLCDAATNGEPVGHCHTGPVDQYCDGITETGGRGFIPCQNNTDCATTSGAGNCTVIDLRRCFPDPILETGVSDTYNPTSSSIFCIAPVANAAINIASGLPGPGDLTLSYTSDIRCQSNNSVTYQFPDGANCANSGVTTTTTLPIVPCEDTAAPTCGGTCPVGEACANSSGTCVCTGVPQCSEASAPICGGLCPTGENCTNIGSTCQCGSAGVPACSAAVAPACGGTCDVGFTCIASGSTCGCVSDGLPTCSSASAPGCAGTCSAGSLCEANGNACQCSVLPTTPP